MPISFLVAIFSLFFSGIATAIVCGIGPKLRLVDMPNFRSSHSTPTPRGGGIGISLAFIIMGMFFTKEYLLIAMCGAASLIGLSSDLLNVSSKIRLALHISISTIFTLVFMNTSYLAYGYIAVPIAIFFVIFLTGSANIYNFMDGINGIAGIMAVVSFGLVSLFSFAAHGMTPVIILTVSIVFSSLGFLKFNVPNARVFMGDVGAIFLGFTFAAVVMFLAKSLLDFICLASFLFVFYMDEVITMFIRLKDGENLLLPHRRHLYQILANEAGLPHWKVSCGYGMLQLLIGLTVLLFRPIGALFVIAGLVLYFAAFVVLNIYARRKWGSA